MKKRWKVLLLILSVLVIACLGLFAWMRSAAKEQLAVMTYQDVEMALVADGAYEGEADAGLVSVKVSVLVKDHAIREIRILEHQNGMGSAAEAIVAEMVEKNRYGVDAVSGATLSSEAIKSAVSKALYAGQTK